MDRLVVHTVEFNSLTGKGHRSDDPIHGPMFRVRYGDAAAYAGRSKLLASDYRVGNALLLGIRDGASLGQAAHHGPNRQISAGDVQFGQYGFGNHEPKLFSQRRQVVFAGGSVAARCHPLQSEVLFATLIGETLVRRLRLAGERLKNRHRMRALFVSNRGIFGLGQRYDSAHR